jgi:hypothetical protein
MTDVKTEEVTKETTDQPPHDENQAPPAAPFVLSDRSQPKAPDPEDVTATQPAWIAQMKALWPKVSAGVAAAIETGRLVSIEVHPVSEAVLNEQTGRFEGGQIELAVIVKGELL